MGPPSYEFLDTRLTTHAIITLTEKNDTGKIVCGIFIDFRKVFDVIPHITLLKKLYSYGKRGNLYDWFESYLSERSQYDKFQNTQSDTKPITHGVPKGSILGPILFIIDIKDFSKASEKLFSILYADDTSVFIERYEYDKLIEIMNNEMNKLVFGYKQMAWLSIKRKLISWSFIEQELIQNQTK